MQKEIVTQKQFLKMLKSGKKEFRDSTMQFFDAYNLKLDGIEFDRCDMNFCTFSNCEFINVIFKNCKMYFGSFYTGMADNLLLDGCSIEMTLFNNFHFSRTKFRNCALSWDGIFNSNADAADMSASTCVKVFNDVSQITQNDIEEVVSLVMQDVGRLDIGMRKKIREIMTKDLDRYGLHEPEKKAQDYERKPASYSEQPFTYGEIRQAVESMFYGAQQSPYKTKKAYETDNKYKR